MLLLRTLVVVLLTALLVPATIVAQVTFTQISLTGNQVPAVDDEAEFSFFDAPSLNASGDVAFRAGIRTGAEPELSESEAIFGPTSGAGSSLGLIAREGDLAPGLDSGEVFSFLDAPTLNASGDVAFLAVLRTDVLVDDDFSNSLTIFGPTSGAGSSLGLIAREGDPLPGAADEDETIIDILNPPSINAAGDVAFLADLRTEPAFDEGFGIDSAILGPTMGAGSPLGVIARTNALAPGTDEAVFDFFTGSPWLNASGDVAFSAFLFAGLGPEFGPEFGDGPVLNLNDAGLFGPTSGAGSSLGLIAQPGDPAPGTDDSAAFDFIFDTPSINDSGDVAFNAFLRTGTGADVSDSNAGAIFGPTFGAGSSLGPIARADEPAPGVDDDAEFDFFFDTPSLNAQGDVAFLAILRSGTDEEEVNENIDSALYVSVAGQLQLIVRNGDPFTVTLPDGSDTQERIISAIDMSPTGLNDAGMLAFSLTFTDDTQGIFTAVPASNTEPLLGDVDLSGVVNFLDIGPFILLLSTGEFQAEADIDQSGTVDFLDISPFIAILAG